MNRSEGIAVMGWAARSAAGDLEGLVGHLQRGEHAFSDAPPYLAEGLSNPRCGRVAHLDRARPAEALLLDVVRAALTSAGPTHGKVGLVVGTSSGNICGPWETWHRSVLAGEPADESGTGRDAPTRQVAEELGLDGPNTTLSVACVSGTAVFAVAEAWLRDELCERVVVAGVDALSLFVHAGFSGLGALASEYPHPFTEQRDGLLLGEGAAALVLELGTAPVYLLGTGMAADAVHMTAPDRHAGGAIRSARSAMERGGLASDAVDTVSVHGTGTPFNDGMESTALTALFAKPPEVQLVKALIGHTMGAAGALEAAVAAHTTAQTGRPVLSMSSAFGGMNASVLFGTEPSPVPPRWEAVVGPSLQAPPSLKTAWPDAPRRALRANPYVRLGLSGIKAALDAWGPMPEGSALVLGTVTGCRLTDLAYHERLVVEGAANASRLQFAYTVPAAPICEASILFGITGPLLCFIGDDPLPEAHRLIRWGHAPAALAIELEVTDRTTPGRCIVRRLDRG